MKRGLVDGNWWPAGRPAEFIETNEIPGSPPAESDDYQRSPPMEIIITSRAIIASGIQLASRMKELGRSHSLFSTRFFRIDKSAQVHPYFENNSFYYKKKFCTNLKLTQFYNYKDF